MPNTTKRPPLNPHYRPPAGEVVFCQDVFSLDNGYIVFQRPNLISEADLQDIEDWLQLIVRGIRRSVVTHGTDLDYTKCPKCGGPTEFDREVPPNPYVCDKCSPNPEEK